jgi:endonuclease YncB( thermonuclease family)
VVSIRRADGGAGDRCRCAHRRGLVCVWIDVEKGYKLDEEVIVSRTHVPAALAVVPVTHGQTVSGPARVIDGDTVVVAGTHVRLKGVDAAELGTPLGEEARQVMVGIVGGD